MQFHQSNHDPWYQKVITSCQNSMAYQHGSPQKSWKIAHTPPSSLTNPTTADASRPCVIFVQVICLTCRYNRELRFAHLLEPPPRAENERLVIENNECYWLALWCPLCRKKSHWAIFESPPYQFVNRLTIWGKMAIWWRGDSPLTLLRHFNVTSLKARRQQ